MTMLTRTLTYLFILFFFLSGCGKPSSIKEEGQRANENQVAVAKQLEIQGNYQKAAQEYLQIAAQNIPPAQQGYQLSAIKAFLKGDMLTEAKAELAKLDVNKSYGLEIPLELIHTKFDLVERRFNQAFQRLQGIEPTTLAKPLQIEYKQLHAQALASKGEVLNAVREWIEIDKLSNSDSLIVAENHKQLWNSLSSDNASYLRQVKQVPGDIFSGWITLALLAKTSPPQYWQQNIDDWQQLFPKHPATQYIVPRVIQEFSQKPLQSQQIALLLPAMKSQFGKFAEAVKNGFFAAANVDDEDYRPNVSRYDVDADNILQVYQKVVKAGAEIVVGPLVKDTLAVLANHYAQLPVPTLGLNHLETPVTINNLYQLGLSPDDEAIAVAKRAWANGHRSALVLVPDGSWGEGILNTFTMEWVKQGGQIARQYIYSKNFHKKLPKLLRNVKTADMVFMVALPQQAPQIRAFLQSTFKERLPIYSISRVYSGTPKPSQDNRLDGIIFVDIPWVLNPDPDAAQLQADLQQSWPQDFHKYKRLYALGIDAYALIPQLQRLRRPQLQGQTGRLSISNQGIIHRDQLHWARFVNGEPLLLEETY